MREIQTIEAALNRVAWRRRWFRAWNGFFQGLLLASLAWLMATLGFKFLPLPFAMFGVLGLAALGAVALGFIWGGFRTDGLLETARWLDQQLGSKECLSAAVELHQTSGPWGAALLQEGLKWVGHVQTARLLTYQLPAAARWTMWLLLASVCLGWVPEYRSQDFLDRQREKEVMKEVGRHLSRLAKRSLQLRPPVMKPTESAMVSVDELGRQLTEARLTRSDALERISSVSERLNEMAKTFGENPAFKRMRQEARIPSGTPAPSQRALQEEIDALQEKMNGASGDVNGLERMKRKLNELQRLAVRLDDEEALSAAMKERMAERISSLTRWGKRQGIPLPDLDDAMAALPDGEMSRLLESLDLAQIDLDQMRAMAKSLQKMQAEAAQMGRTLGEQLERGQVQAAHHRLMEMTSKNSPGSTGGDQPLSLMKELSDALEPARDYGAVGALLKQAIQATQDQRPAQASESLRAAAEELKRLTGQLGDVQSLMASLEELKNAQQCVGNGMGWGQVKGGRPKPGTGGMPGAGVGTWADENAGWFYVPETAERWDDSGLTQPETDARGHTDRGEGEVASGMIPTTVRGRFTPGSAMPSLPLKGLSIRGQSRIHYEEAMSAAQDAAQSALSQQKVPRAYQQSVKGYFDEFEEPLRRGGQEEGM